MATADTSNSKASTTENAIYAGDQLLQFQVAEMPAGTRIYVYCNGLNITSFCAPVTSGAAIGDPIVTNQLGQVGGYLYIPSDDGQYKFLTGEILLTFSDSSTGIQNSKYISEATLYNHGMNLVNTEEGGTVSLRKTIKFRTSPLGNALDINTSQLRLDPCSQTFFVESTKYPLGVYVTGITLYVFEKDSLYPLAVELRPMDGGKPSTKEYFEGSYILKNPSDIQVYDTATNNANPTDFTFKHPIYLKPGEYAFCVLTKSGKYTLLGASTNGGKTVKQPFAGRLFKPQNTGEWVESSTEDLAFVVRKAAFETGTVTIEAKNIAIDGGLEYNRFRLLSTAIDFSDTASVNYNITTKDTGSNLVNDPVQILPGLNADLTGRQTVQNAGDITLQIQMTTKDRNITPMLDKQLIQAQIFRTAIDEYSKTISDSELKSTNGGALARYISKPVSLADGFDSTGMEVKLSISRQIGTDVDVFCRVLARNDNSVTNGIYDRPWLLMPLVLPKAKTYAGTEEIYQEETYRILDPLLSYIGTSPTGTAITGNFDDFAFYQIKVVFYSSNPVYLPRLKSISAVSVI